MAAVKKGFVIPSGLGVSANDLYLTSTTDATNSTGSLIVCLRDNARAHQFFTLM